MKTFILTLRVAFIVLSMQSCHQKEALVVQPGDYSLEDDLRQNEKRNRLLETKRFWESRNKNGSNDFTAMLKLASAEGSLFKQTGDINSIRRSDSLLHIVEQKSIYDRSSIAHSLALNAMARHEFWKAKKYILQAIDFGENKSSSLFTLSDIMLELGNADSAATILNNFTNTKSFAWMIRRAKLMDHYGELDSAIALMETAVKKVKAENDMHCWAVSTLGDLYGHAGRIHDSYKAYLTALRNDPGYDYALKGIAWIALSHDQNFEEARRILFFLSSRTKSPEYYLMLSEIAYLSENPSERKHFQELFYKNASLMKYGDMYNRHLSLLEADNSASTANALLRAKHELSIRPTVLSYDLMAWTLYRDGKTDLARQIASEHVEGKTSEPLALYHMGTIYIGVGEQHKGESLLREAMKSSFELGPITTQKIKRILNG